MTLISAPRIHGSMRESPDYRTLGIGTTDRVFLIGHGNLPLNDPLQVVSLKEAAAKLDTTVITPLLRGLLETYYSGCRDIYLVAAAPMDEYVENVDDRNTTLAELGGKTFYERYAERLAVTYESLLQWDLPQIIVPLEASLYRTGDVDFLTPLADHCIAAFHGIGEGSGSSNFRIGILGTRGTLDQETIDEITVDEKLNLGSKGKFVLPVVGEGIVNIKELPTTYGASLAASTAGELSHLPLDRGLVFHRYTNVAQPAHGDLTPDQIEQLTSAKLNPVVQTVQGRRGVAFQTVLLTDNTLGQDGSDFWSLTQVRLVIKIIDRIRAIGRREIGNIGMGQFKMDVESYMHNLSADNVIRGFSLNIHRDEQDRGKVYVDVSVRPYFGVREITFVAEVGPDA